MELEARHLYAGYDDNVIIRDLTLRIPAGKVTALIGANGCGKSTLLKTICRIQPPLKGQVLLDGVSVHEQDSRRLASSLAILPQNPSAPGGLTVRELVSYGRAPHQKHAFSGLTREDADIIDLALAETDMTEFANRPIEQLSGGQRQRAWIAMAVAQHTDILFLDEPTSFLDISHQMEILTLVRRLNRKYGKTIVMVIHELNEAARFADYIIAMKKGEIRFSGTPEETMTKEMLDDVFGVEAEILQDPRTKRPFCIPMSGKERLMTSNAKVKCLCACLGLMLSASFLGGCASLSWQSVGGDLPVLDQESMRSDTPQAVDQELQKRFAKKEAAAQAMFSHDGDGRLVLHHKYGTTVLPDQPSGSSSSAWKTRWWL